MPSISFVDPLLRKTLYKEISIQVSLNGFSFLITTPEKRGLAFRYYDFKGVFLVDELIRRAADILQNDELLGYSFAKTRIVYLSQKSTLVPEAYFDPDHLKKLFEFSHSLDELDELHYNHLYSLGAYNVFALPNYLANAFQEKFDCIPEYQHQATVFLELAEEIQRHQPEGRLFININKGFFDVAVYDSSKLLLSNSFQYVHETDFIYFLLYVCKELGLEPHKQELVVMGEHAHNEHLVEQIKSYVRSMKYIDTVKQPATVLKKMDFNLFYALNDFMF